MRKSGKSSRMKDEILEGVDLPWSPTATTTATTTTAAASATRTAGTACAARATRAAIARAVDRAAHQERADFDSCSFRLGVEGLIGGQLASVAARQCQRPFVCLVTDRVVVGSGADLIRIAEDEKCRHTEHSCNLFCGIGRSALDPLAGKSGLGVSYNEDIGPLGGRYFQFLYCILQQVEGVDKQSPRISWLCFLSFFGRLFPAESGPSAFDDGVVSVAIHHDKSSFFGCRQMRQKLQIIVELIPARQRVGSDQMSHGK